MSSTRGLSSAVSNRLLTQTSSSVETASITQASTSVSSRRSVRSSRKSSVQGSHKTTHSKKKKEEKRIRVLDAETGQDVTPIPLLEQSRRDRSERSKGDGSPTESDAGSESGLFSAASFSRYGSETSFTIRTGSTSPRSVASDEESMLGFDDNSSDASALFSQKKIIPSSFEDASVDREELSVLIDKGLRRRKASISSIEFPSLEETPPNPDELISFRVEETDTIWLFDMPAVVVSTGNEDLSLQVEKENEYYQKRIISVPSSNKFSKEVQTFNRAMLSSGTQRDYVQTAECGCNVSAWEIYDDMLKATADQEDDVFADEGAHAEESDDGDEFEEEEEEDFFEDLEMAEEVELDEGEASVSGSSARAKSILSMPNIVEDFMLMERLVIQNEYHKTIFDFKNVDIDENLVYDFLKLEAKEKTSPLRGAPEAPPIRFDPEEQDEFGASDSRSMGSQDSDDTGSTIPVPQALSIVDDTGELLSPTEGALLAPVSATVTDDDFSVMDAQKEDDVQSDVYASRLLWTYSCSFVRNRSVSVITEHKLNSNIYAAGYGNVHGDSSSGGYVLVWTLKNIMHPERYFRTPFPVVCLDFSRTRPNLLAAGLSDGSVVLLDMHSAVRHVPVLESSVTTGKHLDVVWDLHWVLKEDRVGERLVSVSSDGLVYEWSVSKGLEAQEINRLKRIANPARVAMGTKADAFISRQAGGMTISFSQEDPNIYLVGTEDGTIHKCSVSYPESYLESYFGHTGAVDHVRWSPFHPKIFLSCSADWTIALWNENSDEPLISLEPSKEAVSDICWSSQKSSVFASTTVDGSVQLWDLKFNTLDPVLEFTVSIQQPNHPDHPIYSRKQETFPEESSTETNNALLGLGSTFKYDDESPRSSRAPSIRPSDIVAPSVLESVSENQVTLSATSLHLGIETPTLLVGDSRGNIGVYRVSGFSSRIEKNVVEQQNLLESCVASEGTRFF